jgi:hypothetical protein
MAAMRETKRIATHHRTLATLVEGWGSSFDEPYTAAIERTMGIAKASAETTMPARERANHLSLPPATCSDTHEV